MLFYEPSSDYALTAYQFPKAEYRSSGLELDYFPHNIPKKLYPNRYLYVLQFCYKKDRRNE